jgi:hypothetical protein
MAGGIESMDRAIGSIERTIGSIGGWEGSKYLRDGWEVFMVVWEGVRGRFLSSKGAFALI